jgi:hypothetical protein
MFQPLECANCHEDLDKNKVTFNILDTERADAMVLCDHCKNTNHISFTAPYIYTWELEE